MSSLISKLTAEHPSLTFTEAEQFSWSPKTETLFFNSKSPQAQSLLLHELSHALLSHREYRRDIELIAMETAAWDKAKELAPLYDHIIDEDTVQDNLDTYREWLHRRSTCPQCTATGFQIEASTYECPACTHKWRVNEARICGLKRYSLS